MKQTLSINAPQNWATFILFAGAILSIPFLRNSPTSADPAHSTSSQSTAWQPDSAPVSVVSHKPSLELTEEDWKELSRLQSGRQDGVDPASGPLPGTEALAALPGWADSNRRLDQIVNMTLNRPPLAPDAPEAASSITPFKTWVDPKLSHRTEPPLITHSAQNPDSLAEELASHEGRWQPKSNDPIGGPGALAGTRVRPFETKPTMWPDEMKRRHMQSIAIAEDAPVPPQFQPPKLTSQGAKIAPAKSQMNLADPDRTTTTPSEPTIGTLSAPSFQLGNMPANTAGLSSGPNAISNDANGSSKRFIQQPTRH